MAKSCLLSLGLSLWCLLNAWCYADLNDGLVAYYPFNGHANDAVGEHHGVVNGALLTQDIHGIANSAYLFDGVDDYIEITDSDALDMGFSDYSLAAWIKTPPSNTSSHASLNNGRIVSKGSSACVTGYMLRLEGERVHLENAVDGSCQIFLSGNTRIADGQWHFIVAVVNRREGGFTYIDGQMDSQYMLDTSEVDFSNDRNIWIGRNDVHGVEAFNGAIDEVRLYQRALSSSEILDLYQLHADGVATDLQAQISDSSDQIIIASSTEQKLSQENSLQTDAFALVTPAQTQTKLVVENSSVVVSPDSVLLVHPTLIEATSQPLNHQLSVSNSMIRGRIEPTVDCQKGGDYLLRSIIADIRVDCSRRRNALETSQFTTSYQQTGEIGELIVSVVSGSVNVTDRNQQSVTLIAGTELTQMTIRASVPRTTWVLPIDNDRVVGGQENLLSWTAYPGAMGYILEYNLPEPSFSHQNPIMFEHEQTSIRLSASDYQIFDDLVLFRVFIGNRPSGSDNPIIPVEGRIFALDAEGNIIQNSTSSDSIRVTWD